MVSSDALKTFKTPEKYVFFLYLKNKTHKRGWWVGFVDCRATSIVYGWIIFLDSIILIFNI